MGPYKISDMPVVAWPSGTLVRRKDDNSTVPRVMSVLLTQDRRVPPNVFGCGYGDDGPVHVLCGWNVETEHGTVFRCKAFLLDELAALGNQNYDG